MTESPNERFERLAEQFERETGMMAPGKDAPAAIARDDYEERVLAWHRWNKARAVRTPEAPRV